MIRFRSLLHDSFRLLTCLSFKKGVNIFKLAISYRVSRFRTRPFQSGYPYAMSVEVSTTCNLHCTECPSGLRMFTRPTGKIDFAFFKQIIDQVRGHLLYLTLYFQGEPYLHPHFPELVRYAHDRGIYTATSTNGHFLTEEKARETIRSGLDRIIVSLDGLDQETYAAYRVGGDVERVKNGIRNLVMAKKECRSKSPYVILQFIVFAHNKHQIEAVKAFGAEVGVDEVQIKSAQIYDFDKGDNSLIDDNKYSRYERTGDGAWHIKSRLPNRCWRLWTTCVATWDGMIVPCCFDKDADHRLGDLREDSLQQIWEGEPYQLFRKRVFANRRQITICRNCSEGL
ncbi:MAG: radical SAM/SPASM domain-containing protein [Bacteroidota bacterium]|nr:radical SAM/SPASM domain-containing protein [Bacteroidota bacterium]